MRAASQHRLLVSENFDPLEVINSGLSEGTPWENITEFATSPHFCGLNLYPRQLTLLKLIYLETEHMTAYDIDVIEEWRKGFMSPTEPAGVQEDIWTRVQYLKDRGYRHFPHIEAIIGRRGSKGKIGGVLGAEKLAYMHSLGSWQDHYGISPSKDGFMNVTATSLTQAKKFQFADIREVVEGCKYLEKSIVSLKSYELSIRTPADLMRIAEIKRRGLPMDRQIATLHATAMSSNSAAGRGATAFANFYDEFAHLTSGSGSARSSEEIYEAFQPSLDQFGKDSMTYMPSSPFTKAGHFYSLYREGKVLMGEYDGERGEVVVREVSAKELDTSEDEAGEKLVELAANPEMLIVQLPSWGLYEDWQRSYAMGGPEFKRPIQQYDERMARLERSNPEKFKVERRSQFASVMDAFLDPIRVEAMFDPLPNGKELTEQERGSQTVEYRIHCDPGLSNANFALSVCHLEPGEKDEDGTVWPIVVVDYMRVWSPTDYEDGIIDYTGVQKEIADILRRFSSTGTISFDQWNSAGMISALRNEFSPRIKVSQENFTEKANQARMQRFKSALNLGWVRSYRDNFYKGAEGGSLLEQELKFLQEKNGKVDRMHYGPVTTKDLADTLMVNVDYLLSDALDKWERQQLGITSPSVGTGMTPHNRSSSVAERMRAQSSPATARDRLSRSGSRRNAYGRQPSRGRHRPFG